MLVPVPTPLERALDARNDTARQVRRLEREADFLLRQIDTELIRLCEENVTVARMALEAGKSHFRIDADGTWTIS